MGGTLGIIKNLMNDNETKEVEEIQKKIPGDSSVETIVTCLEFLCITQKLIRRINETKNTSEIKLERLEYLNWYLGLKSSHIQPRIVYIDECVLSVHFRWKNISSNTDDRRQQLIFKPTKYITMLIAVDCEFYVNGKIFVGEADSEDREKFLANTVSERLEGTNVLVINTTNFHHGFTLPENSSNTIKNLPPYSPMLSPCEELFSTIKSKILPLTRPKDIPYDIEEILDNIDYTTPENNIEQWESIKVKIRNLEDL
ncbi:hypothetical protein RF11_10702 [Thelohanellus kitauei]|uniref:Tc1-like transposase DDE domain-containing protein n=1 Tax=Thelohanellus kitauei TaxID=669202 RepID=A0A0C2JLK8_THEKT|nr:hypothetical protein RF11_10702 [Thelohanellus kitauei]